MAGIIYAGYELIERPGETELTALFKGRHVIIPGRLRAVKMPQSGSSRIKATMKPDRLKELFGQVCQAAAQAARALDAVSYAERAAAERIGFIETIHFVAARPVESQPPKDAKPAENEPQDYIITEWVGGGTLTERIAVGALPLTDAVRIATGVLEGLEYAHSHDVVHGNLKPNNVLLTPEGEPKVVDFGGNILSEGTPLRLGSVPYLSPEQLEPGQAIDGQTDLFSMTLILYEMLTGRRVPRLLSAAQAPSKVNPQIPAGFDDLIVQGLQSDPQMRFRSASEMLERILQASGGVRSAVRAAAVTPVKVSESVPARESLPAVPEPALEPLPEPAPAELVAEIAAPAARPEETPPEPAPAPNAVAVVTMTRRAGERRINAADGAEMVWAPAGLLRMGSDLSPAEQPVQDVSVSGVWIYKYPVTQGQYMKYRQYLWAASSGTGAPTRPSLFKRGDEHVNKAAAGIRWDEACDYASWVGARLPTEAEWEWAARGPDGLLYPWGHEWVQGRANVAETTLFEQSNVDRYTMGESWCGAIDLLGNVYEWCSSLFRPYPYDPADGREENEAPGLRTLRGGSALTPAELVRATFRCAPSSQTSLTGFRLVMDADN